MPQIAMIAGLGMVADYPIAGTCAMYENQCRARRTQRGANSLCPLALIGLSPPDRLDRRSPQEFRENRQLSATTRKREEDQVCVYTRTAAHVPMTPPM
jgi:hypothetical protein